MGLTTAATLWLSAAIGLAVRIGYYEGAIIATAICLITLISLKWVSDIINQRVTKSCILIFDTDNFDQDKFIEVTSKEGVEVRKLDIIDEDMDDRSMVEVSLSLNKNYNVSEFFKKLKTELSLRSVKLSNGNE